jgi:hypothetical protein
MSLDSFIPEERPATLNGKAVMCKPLTLRQYIRLAALADRIKGDISKTREQLAVEAASGNLPGMIVNVVSSLVGQIDLDDADASLKGNALLVCRELGAIVGVTAEDVADADLNELYDTAVAMWEVNKAGPFGKKMGATIATFQPMITVMAEAMAAGFQLEFMKGLRPGGTDDGGMIGLSSPSLETFNGPRDTFLTGYPAGESLSLQQAPLITDESEMPLTKQPEAEPEPEPTAESPDPAASDRPQAE